ncbi:permease [Gemmatirosa kalamazoonensis]|uniref:Permease n=1 Tax=Gemmatirosa kalamazoonensis TaxID=861299 RepID=W0RG38_9BACT|nr:ABC transporter permease [Gemmatirosa kalamazoonensis]AHG89736.1 permease [Gemmatirosa kalamazoonensis]
MLSELWSDVRYRLRALFDRDALERELDAELRFHLDREAERHERAGLSRDDALRRARAEFGRLDRVKEASRRARGTVALESALQDLRVATRRLRRAPGFVAAAVLVLALGIGATTATFSLVNAVLLEPLPYPRADRLVRLTQTASLPGLSTVDQSDASVMLYQRDAASFEGIAAWWSDNVDADIEPSAPSQAPARVQIARVTANLLDVLRVRPAIGRGFAPGEDRAGAPRVILLSDRLWRERYHGDPHAIGRRILVNEVPRTIVGVMPRGFGYPASTVDLWIPLTWDPANVRAGRFAYVAIGRLRDGVSTDRARADLARVLTRLPDEYPGDASAAMLARAHVVPSVEPLRDSIVGPVARLIWVLMASALLVLVVAGANVAGLFLVRAEHAQAELAVRAALGSGARRLVAQSLGEAALLGAAGGALGVVLAVLGVKAAVRAGDTWALPRLDEVGVDPRTLSFALAATVLCALCVSLLPLLRARRVPIALVLRSAGRGTAADPSRQRARDALVVAQTALALVLVASSGLMARSVVRLERVQPGFVPDDVAVAHVLLPAAKYTTGPMRARFLRDALDRLRAAPGVRDAGITDRVPLGTDGWRATIEVEDRPLPPDAAGATHPAATVDGDYFGTMRIPLLRGRSFGPMDEPHTAEDVVVSHAFALRYWNGASPVGKRIRPVGGTWLTIVGEVGDVHYDALDRPAGDVVYFPFVEREGDGSVPYGVAVLARTEPGRAPATVAAIRDIVRALDPALPTFGEETLDDAVRRASARARALVVLLAVASVVALTLGAVGLYGVVAYAVSVRRREIGVRIALGARPADVSRAVSLHGLRLAAVGVAIGLAGALVFTRLLRGLLYEVSATDPWVLGLTIVALLAVALVASWLPARRAAAVNPAEVLGAG